MLGFEKFGLVEKRGNRGSRLGQAVSGVMASEVLSKDDCVETAEGGSNSGTMEVRSCGRRGGEAE